VVVMVAIFSALVSSDALEDSAEGTSEMVRKIQKPPHHYP